MNCPLRSDDAIDLLLDYSAGRLDKTRSALLERHMNTCSGCAAFRMEQTAVWDALDAWEPEPVSMGFNRTLWQKIEAEAGAPWHRRFADSLHFKTWKPAFSLAIVATLIATGLIYDHPGGKPAGNQSPTAQGVSVTDAEQVEKTLDDIQLLRQFDTAALGSSGTSKPM